VNAKIECQSVEELDRILEILRPKFPCGGCTACCTVVGVEELGKPYNCKCEHDNGSGCAIYGKHPGSCKEFACFWAMGIFGDIPELRPDRLGVLLVPAAVVETEGMSLDIYPTREITPQELDTVRKLANLVLAELPVFECIRLYPLGAKVGVGYPLRDPYPKTSATGGNEFATIDSNHFVRYWIGASPLPPAPYDPPYRTGQNLDVTG
jgi:hypothetical protein